MKKISQILSLVCVFCMMVNILVLPSGNVSAANSESRIVHIYNMWNSNCMINDGGIAKYSPSDSDASSVWTIAPHDSSSYTIRNWNGTYLRASDNSVVCQEIYLNDDSYLWKLISAGGGKYWIESVSQSGKALNIENLTGSIQLTNYYDTWESAKWIIDDTSAPEFQIESDNVIFRSVDNETYLYEGELKGKMNTMQASIIDGNYLYRIIDKGDYCYIQYNPTKGKIRYLKAEPYYFCAYDTLDETSVNYRWNIQRNDDGSVSIVSVAYPGKCIINDIGIGLVDVDEAGDSGKWNMYPGNSLMLRLTNSSHTHTLMVDESHTDKAIFKYNSDKISEGLEAQWQVVYCEGKMYLRNGLTGKFLRASGTDEDVQACLTDYDAAIDELFVWEGGNQRYSLGISNNKICLRPDYKTDFHSDTEDLRAVVSYGGGFGASFLDFEVVGFTE